MRIVALSLLVMLQMVLLVSCQKEVDFQFLQNNRNNSGGGTITGDWRFVGMDAKTKSIVEVSDMGMNLKGITISDYVSKNNKGTVKITSSAFIFSGIAYDIDTVLQVQTYIDNILFDDSELPFVLSYPATSSNYNYTKNSTDSITFMTGFMIPGNPSVSGSTTGPTGAKISWASDTLLITIKSLFTTPVSQGGATGLLTGDMNGTIRLKKI